MEINTKELVQKYPYVSEEEVEKIRESKYHFGFHHTTIESAVGILHRHRKREKIYGKESVLVGPLIHVLSVKFLTLNHHVEPLIISGRIYTKFHDNNLGRLIVHDLFNRNSHDGQVLGLDGNCSLILTNPQPSSHWPLSCMPLHDTKFVVNVAVGGKVVSAKDMCCDDELIDIEQVKQKHVDTDIGEFVLRYVAMPFAVYGEVQIIFYHKHSCKLVGRNHGFLDIKGRIVARYSNPGEVYDSEECLLFYKQSNEYERVDFEQEKYPLDGINMRLSRSWVGVPINSSLFVDLDLSEFESERKLLNESLEFRVQNEHFSYKDFIVDDMLITVGVGWSSPMSPDEEDESSDEELSLQGAGGNDSDDEHMTESSDHEAEASTNPMHPCFKREANDAFILSEGSKTIPLLDGSLVYDECDSLNMKIDLKDVESSMRIRGYIDWNDRTLEFGTKWFNKPLCSVVECEYSFAAIHYSFFPEAVKANFGVACTPKGKNGSRCLEMFPKVHGNIVAQHNSFDYTWHYNREYYRVALFQRDAEHPLQTSGNGEIQLSRSLVVVPMHSSLTVELSLCLCAGDDQDLFSSTVDLGHSKNDFNVKFMESTGPEIRRATGGQVDAFVSSTSIVASGTVTGAGRFLKRRILQLKFA
ncbi:Cysteine synthase B [Bienertia sinuspersici]